MFSSFKHGGVQFGLSFTTTLHALVVPARSIKTELHYRRHKTAISEPRPFVSVHAVASHRVTIV